MSTSAKTQLKEMAEKGLIASPTYASEREGGTEHEPGWKATVTLGSGESATGVGHSKGEAEENAAAALLQKVRLSRR